MKKHTAPLSAALAALLVLASGAVLACVCTEALVRSSLSEAVFWLLTRPTYSLPCTAFYFALSLFLLAATRRLSLSLLLTDLLAAAVALIHVFKMNLRGEPLLLSDFFQAGEAMGVVGGYDLRLSRMRLLMLAVMLLPALLCFGARLPRRRLPVRAAESALAAALLILTVLRADALYAGVRIGDFVSYYESAGVPAALIGSRPRRMAKPEEYGRETVEAALSGAVSDPAAPEVLPDVFFVMCETLFDPASIPGLTLSAPVFPNLTALQAEGYGGALLVSQYGGGTAQTEYEVLTGYRALDTSGSAYVTSGALRAGMASLPRLFSRYGYRTEAMHPSTGRTYNRTDAYAALGFDRGVFREDMSEITAFIGGLPADSWFFPEILAQRGASRDPAPYFAFAVTFQNHGGYIRRPVEPVIGVSGPTGDALTEATNYVNGLRLTDEAVGAFCEALRSQERPAVVVLFGDHGPSFSLFGSSPGGGAEAALRAHETPLLVWANYPLDTGRLPSVIPAYRLGAEIAALLGLRADAYLNSLLPAPALYHEGSQLLEGGALTRDPERWAAEDARLRLLHYDRLLGKGWSVPQTD